MNPWTTTSLVGRLFVKDLIEADGGHRTVSFQSISQEAKITRQKAWDSVARCLVDVTQKSPEKPKFESVEVQT